MASAATINVINQIIWAMLIILIMVAISLGFFFFFFVRKFKHRFRGRMLVKGRTIIIDRKAREFVDKGGVVWWQFMKKVAGRRKVQVPNPQVIDIAEKGQKVVEAYITESGDFVWIHDVADPTIYKKWHKVDSKGDKIEGSDYIMAEPLTPFGTEDRVILQAEFEKAASKRAKGWKDMIVPITAITALTVIIVFGMIFWGDIAKPVLEAGKQNAAITAKQTEILNRYDALINNRQVIGNGGGGSGEPPPD